jgi:hypothetical protein
MTPTSRTETNLEWYQWQPSVLYLGRPKVLNTAPRPLFYFFH